MGEERADESGIDRHSRRFFLADRDVGWIAGSATLAATQVSAGTLVGAVGLHYATGVGFLLAWFGIWLGWMVSLRYIAPQMRAHRSLTVPDFLQSKFSGGTAGNTLQILAAVLIVSIYLVFTSAQYVAGSLILTALFDLPRTYGVFALAGIALAYTTVGGMRASVVSDILLIALVLLGLLTATLVGLANIGGPVQLYISIESINPALLGLNNQLATFVGFALAFGLSIAVAPYEMSRIYAMESESAVEKAILGSVGIQAVIAVCVLSLGLLARVRFPALSNPDAAVVQLFLSYFGPAVGGLLSLGILASVLSTVDSILIVSASALVNDVYGELTNRRSPVSGYYPEKFGRLVPTTSTLEQWLPRAGTVVAGIVPLFFVTNSDLFGSVVQLIILLYSSLVAGAFFIPIVLALHWERMTKEGTAIAMVVGTLTVLGWHFLVSRAVITGTGSVVPPVLVGVGSSLIVAVIVSVGTPRYLGT